MLASILEDVRREFRMGNMVTRIVIVNATAFLLINALRLIAWLGNAGVIPSWYLTIRKYLTLSSDPWFDLTHPWVFFTSMFLHEGFWHLLWNMLFLYWFGRIVGDLIGNHRILPLYLLGGLFAGLVFVATAQLPLYGTRGEFHALGASGAVMAIVLASAVIAPDYRLHLLLIGEVRLKYVVGVLIVLDLIGLAGNMNTGGHFAHLGGAFFGYLFVILLREGIDAGKGIYALLSRWENWPRRSVRRPKLIYRADLPAPGTTAPSASQKRLDAILEKIKHQGMDSLSAEEREFLEKQSRSS